MSKAILVMDMPERCTCCPLHFLDTPNNHVVKLWCGFNGNEIKIGYNNRMGYRPDWCPLKEAPKELVYGKTCNDLSYADGWNDCLKKLSR